jgi:hypothetical protein
MANFNTSLFFLCFIISLALSSQVAALYRAILTQNINKTNYILIMTFAIHYKIFSNSHAFINLIIKIKKAFRLYSEEHNNHNMIVLCILESIARSRVADACERKIIKERYLVEFIIIIQFIIHYQFFKNSHGLLI